MCVVCKQRLSQKQLFRFVKNSGQIIFDSRQKIQGRGLYICQDCINKLNTKLFNRVFKTTISDEKLETLKEVMIDTKTTK